MQQPFTSGAGIPPGWHHPQARSLCQQCSILDAPSNRDLELMRIDDASKCLSALLPFCCFPEQVYVLSKEDTPQRGREAQQCWISQMSYAILMGRQDVDCTQAQSVSNSSDAHAHP